MNIAEILKYCPKGIKLYSTIHGEVILRDVNINEEYPIVADISYAALVSFTEEGHYVKSCPDAECVLFPSKDQRDWSKFKLPIKQGDIMMMVDGSCPFIASGMVYDSIPEYYCGIGGDGKLKVCQSQWYNNFYIPASEEAKKKLFDKMTEAGYRWNADTLELEKIESKFKEGDVVVDGDGCICLVSKIKNSFWAIVSTILYKKDHIIIYNNPDITRVISNCTLASIADRNKLFSALVREGYKYDKEQHKLIKQKVRDDTNEKWSINIFSYYDEEKEDFPYICLSGCYLYCIPYEGNEYLLGTTDSPTWTDKKE